MKKGFYETFLYICSAKNFNSVLMVLTVLKQIIFHYKSLFPCCLLVMRTLDDLILLYSQVLVIFVG